MRIAGVGSGKGFARRLDIERIGVLLVARRSTE